MSAAKILTTLFTFTAFVKANPQSAEALYNEVGNNIESLYSSASKALLVGEADSTKISKVADDLDSEVSSAKKTIDAIDWAHLGPSASAAHKSNIENYFSELQETNDEIKHHASHVKNLEKTRTVTVTEPVTAPTAFVKREDSEERSSKAEHKEEKESAKAEHKEEKASTKAEHKEEKSSTKAEHRAEKESTKAEHRAEKSSTKAEHRAEKESTKAEHRAEKSSTKAEHKAEKSSMKAEHRNATTKAEHRGATSHHNSTYVDHKEDRTATLSESGVKHNATLHSSSVVSRNGAFAFGISSGAFAAAIFALL
ncbi:hypothetical protein DASB73_009930 [Starmerella bacillaris]|uniref:Uncharacterized protein n=1 Tax=Starmerella bacillaris TaxID=1247836 RepID=A0AAV5RES4_STABA|nr:hypothetical protein DASB73_009930 [Starmerella bacillaris]